MTAHSAIGILVAVAVPLWLVVEQVLSWKAAGRRPLFFRAWTPVRRAPKAVAQGDRPESTDKPLAEKAS